MDVLLCNKMFLSLNVMERKTWSFCLLVGGTFAPGADLGFLEEGFKSIKRGSLSTFYLIFHEFPMKSKYLIVWPQWGGQANHPNPL